MSDLLEHYGSKEATLLLYLAGELDPSERADLDRRLAADAGLRAALDHLRATDGLFQTTLGSWDAATPLPVDESVAVRNVGRAMRQWHAAPAAVEPAATVRAFPRWAYPAAAAAVVLIVVSLAWRANDWGNGRPSIATGPTPPTVELDPIKVRAAETLARDTEEWALDGRQELAMGEGDDTSGAGLLFGMPMEAEAP